MRSSAKKTVIEKGRFWIFVWVAAVNTLMILLGRTVAAVGYRSWSFFLCNILYFAMSEGEPRKKLVKLALGSAAGCAFAALTVLVSGWLEPGMGEAAAIVPVVVTLALVILAEPLLPSVFNSAAFLYYNRSADRAAGSRGELRLEHPVGGAWRAGGDRRLPVRCPAVHAEGSARLTANFFCSALLS